MALLIISCGGKKKEVKVTEIRGEVERHDDLRYEIGSLGGDFLKDVEREYIRVLAVEEDWRLVGNPVSGPFPPLMAFAVGENSRATLNVRLNGDLLGNVNRWREGQFSLEKINSLNQLEKIKMFDRQGFLVELEGTFQGRDENWGMLSAILFHQDLNICVLKLTGPADEVKAQKEGFKKMLENFSFERSSNSKGGE